MQSFPYETTANVAKSSHQDRGPCYLHEHFFYLYILSSSVGK